MDLFDRARGLQHHDPRFAGRRGGVIDARGRVGIEEDRRAPGRAPRIGEVPDANARHVDERSRARRRRGLRGHVLLRQVREHASRQKRLPEIAPGEIGHT